MVEKKGSKAKGPHAACADAGPVLCLLFKNSKLAGVNVQTFFEKIRQFL
jgi:hypothetical protein